MAPTQRRGRQHSSSRARSVVSSGISTRRFADCTALRRPSGSATTAGRTSPTNGLMHCRMRDSASTASSVRKMQRGRANPPLFWTVILVVVVADVITKALAVNALFPQRLPHEVLGSAVRLTLVYNPGAAFGLHLGAYSRWIFMALTVGALFILSRLYRATRDGDLVRTLAIALVCGGSIDNLIDRIRSAAGAVDFIDVGIGDMRWPTFTVADMDAILGAFLLVWVLWGDENADEATPGDHEMAKEVATVPATPVSRTGTDI